MTAAKPTLAERAAAHARVARDHAEAKGEPPASAPPAAPIAGEPGPQPERSHWLVYKPGVREPLEVVVHPPQTQASMREVYPGCGCVPQESVL